MMSGILFHFDAATRRFFFEKVPDAEVEKETIERAKEVCSFVCPELGIEPPGIVWIGAVFPTSKRGALIFDALEERDSIVRLREDTTGGFTPCNHSLHEISILRDLKAFPNLEYVVAHELRHAWQKKYYRDVYDDKCRAEGDAYPYGYDVLERYLASKHRLTAELREDINKKRTKAQAVFEADCPGGVFEIIPCGPEPR